MSQEKKKSHAFVPGPPTVDANAVNSHREGALGATSRTSRDDDQKPDCISLKVRSRFLKIGSWNVRTLNQDGKLENLTKEAESLKMDKLGLAETRLLDEGKLLLADYSLFYSGGTDHQYGEGILLKEKFQSQ